MEYLIGLILASVAAGAASVIGFDRERSFYSTVLIVIAAYYVLFAAMGASNSIVVTETAVAGGFFVLAVLGFRKSLWFAAAAVIGHGVFDYVHHFLIDNPGVPRWWPGFCGSFDVIFGSLPGNAPLTATRFNLQLRRCSEQQFISQGS